MSKQHENTITTKLVDILNRMRSTWILAEQARPFKNNQKCPDIFVTELGREPIAIEVKLDGKSPNIRGEAQAVQHLGEELSPIPNMVADALERRKFMIPPITKLIIKIEQLEWDLAEVKKELEKLQAPFMKSLTPEERLAARSARVRAQNERLRSLRKKRDPEVKTLTAEQLQQLSLEAGIDPEENLLSSAIIEEREKRSQ